MRNKKNNKKKKADEGEHPLFPQPYKTGRDNSLQRHEAEQLKKIVRRPASISPVSIEPSRPKGGLVLGLGMGFGFGPSGGR